MSQLPVDAGFGRTKNRAAALRRLGARARSRASTQSRLREAEAKYRTLVEQLPLVTYIDALTASATSVYASPQVEPLLGYSVEDWLGDPEFFPKLLHPDDHDRILDLVEHCNETAEPFRAEYRLIARDGRTVWVQDESLVVCDDHGRPLVTQGYLLDITGRKESEQRLGAEHGVARVLAGSTTLEEATPQIVQVVCEALGWDSATMWLFDREENVLRCASTHSSRPPGAPSPANLPGDELEPGAGLAGQTFVRREASWVETVEHFQAAGAYAVPVLLGSVALGVLEFHSRELREPDAKVAGTVGVIASQFAQFIERKQSEKVVWHQALHDGLTGLPNRTLFHDRVRQAVELSRRGDESLAVLVMDLDCFKEVNDTLGHQCGDALLHDLGSRLADSVRACDTVARLGGDEFGFLLPGVGAAETAALVDRIQHSLGKPFTVQQLSLEVEASIGIALYPEHGASVEQLLQRADVAMYVAKRAGVGCAFYDADEDHNTPIRLTIVGELRRALEQRELVLFYQPQVELDTGLVTGVEALLRWQHPTRGLLSPAELLPIAERTGLMDGLTRYVLDAALCQRQQWQREGHELTVAVNISLGNVQVGEFASGVEALLEKWNAPASCLKLEVTEHSALADPFRAAVVLEHLGHQGIRVSIDDFGTGYSSLAYLRRLPLDEVKIDSSFVSTMTINSDDAIIVRSTIDLARNLGLRVVAEGVDTEEIRVALAELGCDSAQGHHWSPAVEASSLTAWLEKRVPVPELAFRQHPGL